MTLGQELILFMMALIIIPFILQAIDETVTEKIYKKERYKARKLVRLQKETEEKAKFLMELGLWI